MATKYTSPTEATTRDNPDLQGCLSIDCFAQVITTPTPPDESTTNWLTSQLKALQHPSFNPSATRPPDSFLLEQPPAPSKKANTEHHPPLIQQAQHHLDPALPPPGVPTGGPPMAPPGPHPTQLQPVNPYQPHTHPHSSSNYQPSGYTPVGSTANPHFNPLAQSNPGSYFPAPAPAPPHLQGQPSKEDQFWSMKVPTLCAWSGVTDLTDPCKYGLPIFLFKLLRLDTHMAQTNLRAEESRLKQKYSHYFTGFNFPTALASKLSNFQYIDSDSWHSGLGPGIAMVRTNLAGHNAFHRRLTEYAGLYLSTSSSDSRIKTPAPKVPDSHASLTLFLLRYQYILAEWLSPYSHLSHLVKELADKVHLITRNLTTSADTWAQTNGPFIIHKLFIVAREFFSSSFTALGPSITPHPVQFTVDQILDWSKQCPPTELPTALHDVLPTAVPPPPPPSGFRQTNPARSYRRNTSDRPSEQPNQNSDRPAPPRRPNSQAHPQLMALFAQLNRTLEGRGASSTYNVLRQANLSIDTAMEQLGLNPQTDCFNFHVRGGCNRYDCTRNHTPRTLDAAKATALQNQIRTAHPQLPPS